MIRRLDALSDAVIKDARRITIPGDPPITGVLVGHLAVADRVALRLVVGGAYMFTEWLPAELEVEIGDAA